MNVRYTGSINRSIEDRIRIRKLFYLLLLGFIVACSKSGAEAAQDTTTVSGVMDEPADDSDSNTGENEEPDDDRSILMGDFMNGAHPTSGAVTLNTERTELVIKDFKSDAGPILELYIANDVQASEYTTLGELQGLEGDFTYVVPEGIDFETHNYVLVWCVEFSVSFGHAILE